ncbi:MAG: hypothetical protein JO037_18215 [Actinobacteria bacterium]|nr:hypothetical protein [Actinomycetota bacterium]
MFAGSARAPRDVPMVSAGRAGTTGVPSTTVTSAPPEAFFAGPGGPPLAGAVFDPSAGGAGLRARGHGGDMRPLGRVSSSSPVRSSPVALEVTAVGEAPLEPPGLSVRLSKPSSL